MRVPISWLKDYVDFDDTIEGLCDHLTFSGIEVEKVHRICDGIVTAKILEFSKHPNADKLNLCKVDNGSEVLDIVCGAPNVAVGMITALAPIGVTVGDFTIRQAKIRGEASFGMLCSEKELGLSDEAAGIMEFPSDTVLGEALGEVVLELEITPNRPDSLSMIGVAREVAAQYGLPLKRPSVDFPELGDAVDSLVKVSVTDPEACPRYTARMLSGIQVGPSPQWMQDRLKLAGLRPINNAVDITNYVLLECGHPMHAFDFRFIEGDEIVVRPAAEGEVFQTLDGTEHEMATTDLMIADGKKAVALAGVMGGANSEIREDTDTVLLEVATFHKSRIRFTARAHQTHTDSSYRFARGVDYYGIDWASRRATALFVEHAGATVAKGVVDVAAPPPEPVLLTARYACMGSLVGVEIDPAEVKMLLERLEMKVVEQTDEAITVEIPTFRHGDLEREVDLIEEFARMYGLDRIPSPAPRAEIILGADDGFVLAEREMRYRLAGLGLFENLNYSLVSEKLLDQFDSERKAERIVLPNPISGDQSILRTSLIPQMVESLARNRSRQVEEAAFFEIGLAFTRASAEAEPHQETKICIGLMGGVHRDDLDKSRPLTAQEMFLSLKGLIESAVGKVMCKPITLAAFEPGQAAELRQGKHVVGRIGILAEGIRSKLRLHDPVAVAELDYDKVVGDVGAIPKLKPIPTFPAVNRDAALVVDESLTHAEIEAVARKAAPQELRAMTLFDIYRGDNLGEGKKSMAYRFTYQAMDRTLKDEEAYAYHNQIKDALRSQLGADVPEG